MAGEGGVSVGKRTGTQLRVGGGRLETAAFDWRRALSLAAPAAPAAEPFYPRVHTRTAALIPHHRAVTPAGTHSPRHQAPPLRVVALVVAPHARGGGGGTADEAVRHECWGKTLSAPLGAQTHTPCAQARVCANDVEQRPCFGRRK